MRKTMKKWFQLFLVMVLTFSMVACSSQEATESAGTEGSGEETYLIGVCEAQATNEIAVRRAYYENYIAPNYNVEFIFSETLQDETQEREFLENCFSLGVDAIIDFKAQNSFMAGLCEDNDVIYVINNSPDPTNQDLYDGCSPVFAGGLLAFHEYTGELMTEWINENASEDGSEGFLIPSCIAASGNVMHATIVRMLLEALQDKYDLTYTMDINDMVNTTSPLIVENDKGINICVYPGSSSSDTWLPGLSSLLQTGIYGVLISPMESFEKTGNLVDEIERSMDMNIKVVCPASAGSTLVEAFETLDSFGNPSLDYAIVKAPSQLAGPIFALCYNALTNGADSLYQDGLPVCYGFYWFDISSAEEARVINSWDDMESGKWVVDTSIIDQLLFKTNPALDPEGFNQVLSEMTYDTIAARLN